MTALFHKNELILKKAKSIVETYQYRKNKGDENPTSNKPFIKEIDELEKLVTEPEVIPELNVNDYQHAMNSQSAPNVVAIVNHLHRTVMKMRKMPTTELQNHPILKMYAVQLEYLTHKKSYAEASLECEDKSKEKHNVTT
jgi:hypothetical protein